MIKKFKVELLLFILLFIIIFFFNIIDNNLYYLVSEFNYRTGSIYFKKFFIQITELGDSVWYFALTTFFIIIASILKVVGPRKYLSYYDKFRFNSFFIFLSILVTGVLTQLIKHIIGRARPNYAFETINYIMSDVYYHTNYKFIFFNFDSAFHSFPSGHSATIFVLAFCIGLFLPKLKIFFIFIASIIAISRVIVGAHFFTDVIGGLLVAYIGFKISLLLINKFFKNSPGKEIKFINRNLVFLALVIFTILALLLAVGSEGDIFISNLFYTGKKIFIMSDVYYYAQKEFILQSYFLITIFVRKYLLSLLLIYMLIIPIITKFLPIKKLYFNSDFQIKEVFFIICVLFFNLGFIINFLLKGLWGRVRPNDIINLGGIENFTPWYIISDTCSKNCSFVSGDAAVGFSLIILYLLTKQKIFFWLSAFMGLLIGIVRILEGGHFVSDIIMAGFVVYSLTYMQFYFFQKKFNSNVL